MKRKKLLALTLAGALSLSLLAELAGTGDWQTGQRFSGSASRSQVASWAESLK